MKSPDVRRWGAEFISASLELIPRFVHFVHKPCGKVADFSRKINHQPLCAEFIHRIVDSVDNESGARYVRVVWKNGRLPVYNPAVFFYKRVSDDADEMLHDERDNSDGDPAEKPERDGAHTIL